MMEEVLVEVFNNITENDFLDFVSIKFLIKRNKLKIELSLNLDLGVEGIDAIEFLKDYSINYKVDITNFDYEKYFLDDGFETFAFINQIFGKRFIPKHPLTLKSLYQGIKNRKLY